MIQSFLNLLFPKICYGCQDLLLQNESVICLQCRHDLPLTHHLSNVENETFGKFYGRLPVEHASSIVYYHKKGIVQQLIHALKYKGAQEVGDYFGTLYATAAHNNSNFPKVDEIIPVPLHPKKLKKRGYNQVTTFGKALAKSLEVDYNDTLLRRNFYNTTQTKKNLLGRTEIGTELFEAVYTEKDHGKHFLLIDDVITTGSTLEACGKALLKIPGVKISIVTMAYAHS